MKEKRRAYIGQDVYIGRPGRLPDVECCHLVFLYGCIIPTVTICDVPRVPLTINSPVFGGKEIPALSSMTERALSYTESRSPPFL
jgi:hypothetical protein